MALDRHIPYFELSKACAKPGCPLCTLVSERCESWFDNLLFEHVSDRPFRAAFKAAGGFCPEHAAKLASYRDGLAVAILYRGILADRLAELRAGRAWKPKEGCPVCVERGRIETEYLGFIAKAEGEAELRAAFETGPGLCLSHYRALRAAYRHIPAWLEAFQDRRFSELLARTDAFIEFSAYGRQAEFEALSEADKVVWKELVQTTRAIP